MNYVTDECMTEFTPNQKQRMNQKIQQYRPNIGGTTITINNDITIIAGSSLQLLGGATLNFAAGKKLVNSGLLSCSNIIMTGSSSWSGTQFNSGSGGTIQYCTISNATYGIYIQETNSLTISNSEIFNCSRHAIYAYRTNYATQPTITNCVIHDNPNSTGIVMYWSSPDIRNCNVYNNYNGLGIADLS
jgi:parallel beta-helix repeat protein